MNNKLKLQPIRALALLTLVLASSLKAQTFPSAANAQAATKAALPSSVLSDSTSVPRFAGEAKVISAAPNQTIYAVISKRDISRIAMEGGRFKYADFKQGVHDVTKADGELRVVPSATDSRPFNIILTTAVGATYTLVLEFKDIPSQTILLSDKTVQAKSAKPAGDTVKVLRSAEHERNVRNLILTMARNLSPSDLEVVDINTEFKLWEESKFILLKKFEGRSMTGLSFDLTNISAKPMRLVEQEFFKAGVYAVSIPKHELAPSESTSIYVVAERVDYE